MTYNLKVLKLKVDVTRSVIRIQYVLGTRKVKNFCFGKLNVFFSVLHGKFLL